MITGRFEFAGTRKFSELPEGALFVRSDLCPWRDYWVEEGYLVYGAREGQEIPVWRKGKQGEEHTAVRLDGQEVRKLFWQREWLTQLTEAGDEGPVWMETKVSAHVTTFGQLPEGKTFIRLEKDEASLATSIYRRRGELGIRLDGDGERKISPLERVVSVGVGDIRAPEYVLIRIRNDGPHGRLYPEKRSRAEYPEHYEIVEGGFPDRISAAERAKQLWSEREELTADE